MANNLANYKANLKDNFGVLCKKFSAAPIGLKAFAIFAVVVTVLHFSIFFLQSKIYVVSISKNSESLLGWLYVCSFIHRALDFCCKRKQT